MSDFAATVASHFLSGPVYTVGSLYSGAFDELGTGCQRILPGLRRSFVAESDPCNTMGVLRSGPLLQQRR